MTTDPTRATGEELTIDGAHFADVRVTIGGLVYFDQSLPEDGDKVGLTALPHSSALASADELRVALVPTVTNEAAREEWRLTFYGSPRGATLWANVIGYQDRRMIGHIDFAPGDVLIGDFLRAIVAAHNAALTRPATSPAPDALREVAEVARKFPRATTRAGGSSTLHYFGLPAHLIWALDRALNKAGIKADCDAERDFVAVPPSDALREAAEEMAAQLRNATRIITNATETGYYVGEGVIPPISAALTRYEESRK